MSRPRAQRELKAKGINVQAALDVPEPQQLEVVRKWLEGAKAGSPEMVEVRCV